MGLNSEKETEKKGGGVVFSVRCLPGLNESTCFWGGCDMDWGMDELGGTQLSCRDYFKEVCIVPFKLC